MLITVSLLLVTTAMSAVMLLVLTSLADSRVAGIREWAQANGVAVIALLLFAARDVIPDVLSIEVANALLLLTASLMLAGYRRYLGLPVPWRLLAGGGIAAFAGVVVFHYVHNSLPLRVVAMSAFHVAICFGIYASLPKVADGRLRYPNAFSRTAALLLGLGHFGRGAFYAFEAYAQPSLLDPAIANLVFFAIGTLALPALSLGAVMLANARVLTDTAYAAEHDHLTGAPSRRAFFDMAERELARARRHGSGLGLLLLDADHFKRINDTYGHGVGDEVLRDLVAHTREEIRKIDYFARLGGEEFGVLLPDASFDTTRAVAERLRAALDRPATGAPAAPGAAYTVSIGLAMLEKGEDFAGLMRRADAALYAAKAGGRNRVEVAPRINPEPARQPGSAKVIRLRP
ncbi:GGDEF domain-containing protein [Massilia sp. LC238]|uniref:GGDEF domain-containing protein n=1 Tax=Massilia sp. LC238 TaxID=1502852 RepID=UPI0004E3352F|nr:GGDEF domain-containing protein [Massilia sp. LC238]KFC61398.1 Diguanylate cyclase (GGDEF) domain-containing protein [Massilia sp. LC238]